MSYTICKSFRFEAAHQLHGLPPNHQCARMHGHSYTIDVELTEPSDELGHPGFVADFGELKVIKRWIDDNLDHRLLNDVMTHEPTSENLALFVFDRITEVLLPDWIAGKVSAVRVHETETSWAEFRP